MAEWRNLLYLKTIWRLVKPKPKSLYKYHSLNPFLIELIEKNSFWASKATLLNDHYDSSFDLTKEFIQKEYLDEIKIDSVENELSSEEFETAKEILLSAFNEKALKHWENNYRSSLGVCCFTSDPLSELMWAHYADSAKGVCLQFCFKENSEFQKKIVPIVYSNKTIIVKDKIDRFKALFKKRTVWKYEKEWRILTDEERLPFNKPNLIGIIFGPRTPLEDASRIQELCKKLNYEVKFTFCNYNKDGLELIEIDPTKLLSQASSP